MTQRDGEGHRGRGRHRRNEKKGKKENFFHAGTNLRAFSIGIACRKNEMMQKIERRGVSNLVRGKSLPIIPSEIPKICEGSGRDRRKSQSEHRRVEETRREALEEGETSLQKEKKTSPHPLKEERK